MPGSVTIAAPATVLPNSLCRAFARSQTFALLENQYRNGESQRSLLVATSRKGWKLAKRLTPTLMAALRAFYDARGGAKEPFYFYDPWETSPPFSYDPDGDDIPGRYTVRFEGEWNQSTGIGRGDVEIALVQIA